MKPRRASTDSPAEVPVVAADPGQTGCPGDRLPADPPGPPRVSQREWKRAIDLLPDALAICDSQGQVLEANRALAELLGQPGPALRGRLVDEVFAPLSLNIRIHEALASGGVSVVETPPGPGRTYTATISSIGPASDQSLEHAPEHAHAHADGAAARQQAGNFGAVVLVRDVTDAGRMQRRLVLGERMAAVGQLAAGLAHEINNPVSFAYSNLQIAQDLLRKYQDTLPPALSELAEMLEESRVGMGRVRDIVRDLRTFTSTEVRGGADEVRLDDIVDLGLRLVRSEVQRRARLVYDRDLVPAPPIRGDAGRLSHLLLNLLNQALQNLPPITDSGATPQVITVRTRVDLRGGLVELVVADTGPTLSPEIRAHLFEPFAQRHVRLPPSVSAAMGLGLAVSYEVVRRHGGEIEARPGTRGGNELIVRLPLSCPAVNSGPFTPRRRRLLFIDEPLMLRSYQQMLDDLHEVVTVSSVREALGLLTGSEEPFDVIFCVLRNDPGGGGDRDSDPPAAPAQAGSLDGQHLYRQVLDKAAAAAPRFVFLRGEKDPRTTRFLAEVKLPHVDKPAGRDALLKAIAAVRRIPPS